MPRGTDAARACQDTTLQKGAMQTEASKAKPETSKLKPIGLAKPSRLKSETPRLLEACRTLPHNSSGSLCVDSIANKPPQFGAASCGDWCGCEEGSGHPADAYVYHTHNPHTLWLQQLTALCSESCTGMWLQRTATLCSDSCTTQNVAPTHGDAVQPNVHHTRWSVAPANGNSVQPGSVPPTRCDSQHMATMCNERVNNPHDAT